MAALPGASQRQVSQAAFLGTHFRQLALGPTPCLLGFLVNESRPQQLGMCISSIHEEVLAYLKLRSNIHSGFMSNGYP